MLRKFLSISILTIILTVSICYIIKYQPEPSSKILELKEAMYGAPSPLIFLELFYIRESMNRLDMESMQKNWWLTLLLGFIIIN